MFEQGTRTPNNEQGILNTEVTLEPILYILFSSETSNLKL